MDGSEACYLSLLSCSFQWCLAASCLQYHLMQSSVAPYAGGVPYIQVLGVDVHWQARITLQGLLTGTVRINFLDSRSSTCGPHTPPYCKTLLSIHFTLLR